MKIYDNIEMERDRVQACIKKYGWTSDHNLDWFCDAITDENYKPAFVEFEDGTGLLTHKSKSEWRIWSDPLSKKEDATERILEFAELVLKEANKVWCDDVSDYIFPAIEAKNQYELFKYYSLSWPVLDMSKYNSNLSGGHFKEIRNAKSKFYREHKVEIFNTSDFSQSDLLKIVDGWYQIVSKKQKEDIYDLKYCLAIKNNFQGFTTSRVLVVDDKLVGINAGYEVPNHSGRFAGIVGLHDYSVKDLGNILYLEDLEWVKNAGYKELDMQGSEYEWELKQKTQYGAVIERKTDTFSIIKKEV